MDILYRKMLFKSAHKFLNSMSSLRINKSNHLTLNGESSFSRHGVLKKSSR